MKNKRASTFVLIAIAAVLMVAAVLLVNRTTIFQEGNPLPILAGIWLLEAEGAPFAEVRESPPTYLTKTGRYGELILFIEDTRGAACKGEEEGVWRFEGEGGAFTVDMRQYSRSYQVWQIQEP